jgi:YD repeat-containing protein
VIQEPGVVRCGGELVMGTAIAIAVLLFSACPSAYPWGDFEEGTVTRQDLSLNGEVRSLRIEHAEYVEESGQWVERGRTPACSYVFDRAGNRTEYINFFAMVDTDHPYRVSCTYDDAGCLIEEAHFKADGTLWHRWVRTWDGQGNLVEWAVYDGDGNRIGGKTYDREGKATERNTLSSLPLDGKPRSISTARNRGNPPSEEERGADGTVICRTFYTYDSEGNQILAERYTAAGLLVTRVVSSYDSHANLVRQVSSRWSGASEDGSPQSVSGVYRFIEYYD